MKVKFIRENPYPNLPYMKLSTYHKKRGDTVSFNCDKPDLVYVSCIFTWNKEKILKQIKSYECKVVVGGYGINDNVLPEKIEHIMPDYNLYGIDYSLGFTSRGCIRNCPWCIVPKKEGKIRVHASITEFLHSDHEKVMLFDNNFQASPNWKENLSEIIDRGLDVCFNQGLDIRLVDEDFVKLLSECSYRDKKFKNKRLYFSFDIPSIEDSVVKGIKILNDAGIKSDELMFYMLIGFNTTFEEDLHRFNVLNDLGVRPYPMLYNNRQDKPLLKKFQRWVIRRYYKLFPFEEYDTSSVKQKRKIEEQELTPLEDYFTKTCPNCGAKNPINEFFCKKCGLRFVETYG